MRTIFPLFFCITITWAFYPLIKNGNFHLGLQQGWNIGKGKVTVTDEKFLIIECTEKEDASYVYYDFDVPTMCGYKLSFDYSGTGKGKQQILFQDTASSKVIKMVSSTSLSFYTTNALPWISSTFDLCENGLETYKGHKVRLVFAAVGKGSIMWLDNVNIHK